MTVKHPNHRYVIIRHPVSGESFASDILIPSGEILRANGPMHHADPQRTPRASKTIWLTRTRMTT